MDALLRVAGELDAMACIVGCASTWVEDAGEIDRAVDLLADVVTDLGEIADEVRWIAGEGR